MQLATIAGSLDVPNWYESGKVFANQHPEIPQRARLAPAADGPICLARHIYGTADPYVMVSSFSRTANHPTL